MRELEQIQDNQIFNEHIENVMNHIDSDKQSWLFGAGISYDAGIPLMSLLTDLVEMRMDQDNKRLLEKIKESLEEDCHVEHILSHIGDLLSLIDRTRKKEIKISETTYTKENLEDLYREILVKLTDTIRYGYNKKDDEIIYGTATEPLVSIEYHLEFIEGLLKNHLGVEKRRNIKFYTTNYDTLLEDALILKRKKVVDGFSGGAMGFWNPKEYSERKELAYPVYKLHGSIDWFQDEEYGLIRTRYGTKYTSDKSRVLIYPQATKYVETQKDPFATIFQAFRSDINSNQSKLFVCGYSFGDNHINNEIFNGLLKIHNNSTLIIFIDNMSDTLIDWQNNDLINERIYCLTSTGICYKNKIYSEENEQYNYPWWTFSGLTNFLNGTIK
ncbi:SIR2 family protein [Aerococcus urinaeequi]|uniref:SIR2 family protein n=1 Tax=Aerococcus urinaeequi TaxID=51665 RepID=UPI003EDA656B